MPSVIPSAHLLLCSQMVALKWCKIFISVVEVVFNHSGQDQNKCSGLRGCHWNHCAAMLGQLILLNNTFFSP